MKLLITQTLLSAWRWAIGNEDGSGWEEFMTKLRRESLATNDKMRDGIEFENHVYAALAGTIPDPKLWCREGVIRVASHISGSVLQPSLYRTVEVGGHQFLLHGKPDAVRAGTVFDVKYSEHYHLNKYFGSPQTPMYLRIVGGSKKFEYVISDGKYMYLEWYYPDEVDPIESIISSFMGFLETQHLHNLYIDKWRAHE